MKIEPVKVTRNGAVDLVDLSKKVCEYANKLILYVAKITLYLFLGDRF